MIIGMTEEIQRVFSKAPWEPKVGYCRAIRMGNVVAVTGTTSIDEGGKVLGAGDPYQQTKRCLELIEKALFELGMTRKEIIRTRMLVTDITRWEEYGIAHGEFFHDCPPATSMIEVRGLIDPNMLIEIEADAVVIGHPK